MAGIEDRTELSRRERLRRNDTGLVFARLREGFSDFGNVLPQIEYLEQNHAFILSSFTLQKF